MTTNWIEEFDTKWQDPMEKKMGKGFALYCSFCSGEWRDDIKDFITTLLEKQREEDINKFVEQIQDKANTTRPNLLLNEIVNLKYDFLKSHDKTS